MFVTSYQVKRREYIFLKGIFYNFYPRVLSRSWGCLSASSPIQSGLEVTQEVSRVMEVTHTRLIITGIASISCHKNRQIFMVEIMAKPDLGLGFQRKYLFKFSRNAKFRRNMRVLKFFAKSWPTSTLIEGVHIVPNDSKTKINNSVFYRSFHIASHLQYNEFACHWFTAYANTVYPYPYIHMYKDAYVHSSFYGTLLTVRSWKKFVWVIQKEQISVSCLICWNSLIGNTVEIVFVFFSQQKRFFMID